MNLYFCIGGGGGRFVGPVGHSGVSGPRNIDALFVMLGWHRYGFYKKRTGPHYAELVFLNPMGSRCHVVDSGASRA
jgi:hypothetical protein